MKNKLLYILIALFLLSSTATSQSIQYSYDNAGNRTSRLQTLTDFQSASGPLYRALSVAPFAANANNTIENLVYTSPTSYTLDSKLPVGSIPYTFNVNPNGSSAFSIPLSLPQGQAGLTPEISINYNSQAGEGILGYGMSLSCISSITRCGQRSFYDGANSAVSMTSALFELDGMRLIKNGSANNYLKEVDDFSRITQHNGSTGNPEYFLVKKKDGTKLYYGNYNGTNAFQKSSAKSATIAWYLAAQEDVHGNYISYQYEQDMTNGDVWLTSITYTLNANHNFQHENKILFSYQRYVEAPDGYICGCIVKRDKILKEITVKTDEKVMRRYTMEYLKPTDIYSNHSPRLYTITEYGEGGTIALNPMRIEWGNAGQRLFKADFSYSQNTEYVQADFNGDGCMDLLTIYNLSTEELSPGSPRDFLVVYRMGGPGGFSNDRSLTTFTKQYKPVKAVVGDFNGDGLDDIFFSTSSEYEYWQTSLIQNNNIKLTKQSYKPSVTYSGTPNIVAMADVNGDGKDELVNVCHFRAHSSGPAHPDYLPETNSLKMLSLSYQGTADVVTGIKNGDGSKRDIGYRLTTTAVRDPKFYNGMYASWNKDIPTFNTVKTVKLGSLYNDALVEDKSYTYASPLYTWKASREFRGFSTVLEQDLLSGLKTNYRYTTLIFYGYPYHYISKKEVLSGNTCLFKTDYSNQSNVTYKPTKTPYYGYPYNWMEVETDNLKGTTKQVQNYHDPNGNVETRTTTYKTIGQTAAQSLTEKMEYVVCSSVSSFPSRVSSYKKTYTNPAGSIVESKRFTYDSKGNMLTETEHGMQKQYTYDDTRNINFLHTEG